MSIDLRSLTWIVAAGIPLVIVAFFENMISGALGKGVWTLLFAAAIVCFFTCTHFYVRRLDEAAWEAQKHAWMWGGLAGMLIGFLLMVAPTPIGAVISDTVAALAARSGEDRVFSPLDHAFHLGALYILIAQGIGFFIVWIGWWAARR